MIQFVYPLVFSLILINFVVTIILDAYVNLLPVFKTLAVHQDAITGTNLVCTSLVALGNAACSLANVGRLSVAAEFTAQGRVVLCSCNLCGELGRGYHLCFLGIQQVNEVGVPVDFLHLTTGGQPFFPSLLLRRQGSGALFPFSFN